MVQTSRIQVPQSEQTSRFHILFLRIVQRFISFLSSSVRVSCGSPRDRARRRAVKTLAHRESSITVRRPFVEPGQTAVAVHLLLLLGYLFLLVSFLLYDGTTKPRDHVRARRTPTRASAAHPRKCTVRADNNGPRGLPLSTYGQSLLASVLSDGTRRRSKRTKRREMVTAR